MSVSALIKDAIQQEMNGFNGPLVHRSTISTHTGHFLYWPYRASVGKVLQQARINALQNLEAVILYVINILLICEGKSLLMKTFFSK